MNIKLANTVSENNAIGKSITVIKNLNCVIKDSIDIKNPVVVITYDGSMDGINYAIIDEFNRKYYIDKIIPLTGHRYELHCRVDVLESFKEDILGLRCIISKQQNTSLSSLYYNDGSYKSLTKTYTETKMFNNGLPTQANYILVVAG